MRPKQCEIGGRSASRRRMVLAWVALTLPMLASAAVAGDGGDLAPTPRVFVLDATTLAETKRRVAANDPALAAAVARLRREAEEALQAGPFSVMDKKAPPPSGDKHDYMSLGPYWWPDPEKPDGLPYIRRDGEVNPEGDTYDRNPLNAMTAAVETLALAYYLTDHPPYADHAARLLRVWYLDEATRMNPHLEYGQAIPGRTAGRGIGIIDTAQLVRLVDAVGLLGGSRAWTSEDQQSLQAWFRQYLTWLRQSAHGREEARATNNHGTWYDAQVGAFALFVGDERTARPPAIGIGAHALVRLQHDEPAWDVRSCHFGRSRRGGPMELSNRRRQEHPAGLGVADAVRRRRGDVAASANPGVRSRAARVAPAASGRCVSRATLPDCRPANRKRPCRPYSPALACARKVG